MNAHPIQNDDLATLTRKVRADLHTLRYPDEQWVVPYQHESGKHVFDVAIIGGGQGGLAVAAGLLRERVDNIVVFDRQPAGLEGPWNTTARMRTLRTPKHLPGIDPTLPNLSPQAWYIARYGEKAWEDLGKIPKGDWQDYLTWCRHTLNLPVQNLVEVSSVTPEDGLFRLDINRLSTESKAKASDFVYARRVVLATGIDGGGAWHIPEFISSALPKDRYSSSGEAIDFAKLAGKRVAVLGAGASAFDNASTALEAGALEATVCIRRKDIQRINPQMWMAKAGFLSHYADMDDLSKWRFMRHMFRYNIPAPQDAYNRLSSLPGASVRHNAAWQAVKLVNDGNGEEIEVQTASGETLRADFLIVAVGFITNFELRPELAKIAKHIALWSDRFVPPSDERDAQMGSHPYLGESFQFVEKLPGHAPYLSRLFNFTYSALVSMGLSASAISGFKYSVPRVVRGVTKSLFLEDISTTYACFTEYSEPEMLGKVPFHNPRSAS
ncbi:FAD-dependent oxidoreductase [Brucella pituitosa]|uniref:FAD-dependent oxidoreductase n=1 Tax=Brucella pituitosa TaxID=571256 RepID=UPI003F4AC6B4